MLTEKSVGILLIGLRANTESCQHIDVKVDCIVEDCGLAPINRKIVHSPGLAMLPYSSLFTVSTIIVVLRWINIKYIQCE